MQDVLYDEGAAPLKVPWRILLVGAGPVPANFNRSALQSLGTVAPSPVNQFTGGNSTCPSSTARGAITTTKNVHDDPNFWANLMDSWPELRAGCAKRIGAVDVF